jgi:hypothetical protein
MDKRKEKHTGKNGSSNGSHGKNGFMDNSKVLELLNASVTPTPLDAHVTTAVLPALNINTQKIVLNDEQAARIRAYEDTVVKLKLNLADLEVHLSELNSKKNLFINNIQAKGSEMLEDIKKIAEAYGIDLDGDVKWNFNTSDMTFYRIK